MDSPISHSTVAVIRTCCEDEWWMQLAQDNCLRLSPVSAEQNFRTVYLTTLNKLPILIAVYSDQLTAVVACCYQKLKQTNGWTDGQPRRKVIRQSCAGTEGQLRSHQINTDRLHYLRSI